MTIRSMLLFALASASLTARTPCVNRGPMPVIPPPYSDQQALCQAPHGQKANLIPPSGPDGNAYSLKLRSFVHQPGGCTAAPTTGCTISPGGSPGEYRGPEQPQRAELRRASAVKIYYWPEVIEWLCKGPPGPLPAGAMIVKEIHHLSSVSVDASNLMSLAEHQLHITTEWTVMVKGDDVCPDGWFWAHYTTGGIVRIHRSWGFRPRPAARRFPRPAADSILPATLSVQGPDSEVYPCPESEPHQLPRLGHWRGDLSTLDNILTPGIRYKWLGPAAGRSRAISDALGAPFHGGHTHPADRQAPKVQKPYAPLLQADPGFLKLFPQLPNLDFSLLFEAPVSRRDL